MRPARAIEHYSVLERSNVHKQINKTCYVCPYNVTLVKKLRRALGEMDQQLKALVPYPRLVPNSLRRQLTATSNSSSKGVYDFFWPPLVPALVANTHTQINKTRL